jgi:hypothetical protein
MVNQQELFPFPPLEQVDVDADVFGLSSVDVLGAAVIDVEPDFVVVASVLGAVDTEEGLEEDGGCS